MNRPRTLRLAGRFEDLLTGTEHADALTLEPFGVLLLRAI